VPNQALVLRKIVRQPFKEIGKGQKEKNDYNIKSFLYEAIGLKVASNKAHRLTWRLPSDRSVGCVRSAKKSILSRMGNFLRSW
jgi:hypothetical protein